MVILCRPVKQNNNSSELQVSHIHLITYDDDLRKVCCHYADISDRESMIEWARKFQRECWSYNQAVKHCNDSIDDGADADIVFSTKLSNKNVCYANMLAVIKECKWPVLLDTSTIINVDKLDDYGFELLGYHEDIGEVGDTMKYCVLDSTEPYLTGHTI